MSTIFFHADDFGVTVEQSKSILECYENGLLNSVSIIPNSKETAESYELIRSAVSSGNIRLVIHLNFVEGPCMASSDLLPHLVSDKGMFTCTYDSMLKLNYSSSKAEVQREFEAEIAAQIAAIVNLTGSKTINIDSHQHYLQIPMIFDALCKVVQDYDYAVNYLRIPVDPLSPVWSTPAKFFQVPLINHVKWALLKFLKPSKKKLSELNCNTPLFFGIPFTCQMTMENVLPLFRKYKDIADKNSLDLELMFHPGAVKDPSLLLDASQSDLVDFYSNDYRALEHQCLIDLKKRIC